MIGTVITNEKNKYKLSLHTAPAVEPVPTAEAKTHLRISHSDDDAYIGTLITVARQLAEQYTNRSFITQTWQVYMDYFPCTRNNKHSAYWWDGVRELPISYISGISPIELPLPPLQSVTHIKTYDNADTATEFTSSNYQVSAYSGLYAQKGRVTLRDGVSWPTFTRNADGVEIQFVAGYGSVGTDVPTQIRQAILEEIAYLYENRGECKQTIISSPVALSLLDPFIVRKL